MSLLMGPRDLILACLLKWPTNSKPETVKATSYLLCVVATRYSTKFADLLESDMPTHRTLNSLHLSAHSTPVPIKTTATGKHRKCI